MRRLEETKFAFPLVIGMLLVVAFLAVPSITRADGGDPFLVHACVNPSGLTRIVGPDDTCGTNQTPVHWPKPVGPASVEVDCAVGTIADALKNPGNLLTIMVKGTCNENVTIARDTVTLQADPAGGEVHGPNSNLATITVAGQDVLIDGLRVTGGRNGIDAVGAIRLTIQNCVVENTGRNGINFTQGANGVVDHCLVQKNGRDGVRVGEGSTAIVTNNTITTNVRRGVHLFQNGNALIGITSTNQPAENMIMNNGNRGISVSTGSSASIGMNTISGNGTNSANNLSNRVGINVNDGSHANLPGGNLITGNTGGGLQVSNAGATLSDTGFDLPLREGFDLPTQNKITGNTGNGGIFAFNNASLAIADAHVDFNTGNNGITLQLQSTATISNTTVNSNTGTGILAFNNASLFIGNSHVDSNTFNGLAVLLRSTADVANSTLNSNTVDGIFLNQGSALRLATPPAAVVMVTGNTVFGLVCADVESSVAGDTSGITGNGIGGTQNVSPACTPF